MSTHSRSSSTPRPRTPAHGPRPAPTPPAAPAPRTASETARTSGAVIDAVGLVKRFGRCTALDGLDLHVAAGEVCGFLGPNGAGKSTTIRILLGMHHRDAGHVQVLGLDPGAAPAEVTRQVSYVPGDVALWPSLTGRQVLDALAGLRGHDRYDPAAERRLIEEFALDPGKKVRTYSKGNRQKVALVAAFAARTPLLILDEPTTGLDPLMEDVFQECVRDAVSQGRSVLLSSHILSEVQHLCDTVAIIKDGRLVESGRLADLRHLAASRITACVPTHDAMSLAAAPVPRLGPGRHERVAATATDLAERRPALVPDADGVVQLDVPHADVNHVLADLLRLGATDITCQPATLDDLFLRHYQAGATACRKSGPADPCPTHPAPERATPGPVAPRGTASTTCKPTREAGHDR